MGGESTMVLQSKSKDTSRLKNISLFMAGLMIIFAMMTTVNAELYSVDPCGEAVITSQGTGGNAEWVYGNNCIELVMRKNQYNPNIEIKDFQKGTTFKLHLFGVDERDFLGNTTSYPFSSMGLSSRISNGFLEYYNTDLSIGYKIQGNIIKTVATLTNLPKTYTTGSDYWLKVLYQKNEQDTVEWIPVIADGVEQPLVLENKISGVNEFYYQKLGDSSFNNFEIDPIYLVDYSPTPAENIIKGELLTDADSMFIFQNDITSIISDFNINSSVKTNPFATGIEVSYMESDAESTTSSTTYVNKLTNTFTPQHSGYYLVAITGQIKMNDAGKYASVRATIGGSPFMVYNLKPKNANSYRTFTTSRVVYLNPTTYNFYVDYLSSDAGAIAFIKNVRMNIYELQTHFYKEVETEQNLADSVFTSVNDLTYNIAESGYYLILTTAEYTSKDTGKSACIATYIDGVQISSQCQEPRDNDPLKDYHTYGTHKIQFLTAGSHNTSIKGYKEGGIGGGVRRARITVIKPSTESYFSGSDGVSTTTSTSYITKNTLAFSPSTQADYLILGTAEYSLSATDRLSYARMTIDGITSCEVSANPKESSSPQDYFTFACSKQLTLDTSSHNVLLQFRTEDATKTAYIKNARIFAIKVGNSSNTEASAITSKFSKTYNPIYDYYLRFYKKTSGTTNVTILAYNNSNDVSLISTTKEVTGTGYFNIDVNTLMNYMTNIKNLTFTKFRLFTSTPVNFSEVQLREEVNDTDVPLIQGCEIVGVPASCLDEIEFHCTNITDDVEVDNVMFTINGVNQTAFQTHIHWDYTLTPQINGTVFYDWTKVHAYDLSGNMATLEVNLTGNYSCNYQEYVNITHTSTLGVDLLNLTNTSARILWTTNVLSDSRVDYGTSPFTYTFFEYIAPLTTNHDVFLDSLTPNTTYYYTVFSSVNPNQTVGEFNFTTYLSCVENWTQDPISCRINDTYIKTYSDANSCGTYLNLPVQNGTEDFCNYCSENLVQTLGSCTANNNQSVDYTDTNYFTCCDVTGLMSDCSIEYYPYNETTEQFCNFYDNDLGNITCQEIPNINLNEKEYCIAHIPQIYLNETFKCISYITSMDNGKVLQTNPEYRERSQSLLEPLRQDPETREWFTPANSIVNFYYTSKNLVPESSYVLTIECSSNQRSLISEMPLEIRYEDYKFVFFRTKWLMDNSAYIIAGVLMLFIIVAVIWMLIRGAFK